MKKILIVEDHADIRRLLRMTLEFENCEIHEASDGRAGIEAATRLSPDVVLLDVMMPGELDGLEVCRRIKGSGDLAHTKVVMLSARGSSADIEHGTSAGADQYLVKPFSPLQVIQVVNAATAAQSSGVHSA